MCRDSLDVTVMCC